MKTAEEALFEAMKGHVPRSIQRELMDALLGGLRSAGYHLVSTPEIKYWLDPMTGDNMSLALTIDGRRVEGDAMLGHDPDDAEKLRREIYEAVGRNLLIEMGLWNDEAGLPVAWSYDDPFTTEVLSDMGFKKADAGS